MRFDGLPIWVSRFLPLTDPETGEPVHVVQVGGNKLLVSQEFYDDMIRGIAKQQDEKRKADETP